MHHPTLSRLTAALAAAALFGCADGDDDRDTYDDTAADTVTSGDAIDPATVAADTGGPDTGAPEDAADIGPTEDAADIDAPKDVADGTRDVVDDIPDGAVADTDLASDADAGSDGDAGGETVCTEFVVMDRGGRFALEGQPYELKGINLHAAIGAVVTNADTPDLAPEDYDWEYFPAPYGNYFPDNHGICYSPWADTEQCCDDAASCREALITQHIDRVVALDAISVRLVGLGFNLTDDGVPYARCDRLWDAYSERDADEGRDCRIPLDDPELRARYLAVVRDTIRLLGERGIRTILLTQGKNADRGTNHFAYTEALAHLSEALADEPWLIGYDPMNEPIYFYRRELIHPSLACPGGGFCKDSVRKITKAWFEALTDGAPHHFVTLGQGATTTTLIDWDPHVVYDHFTSWHVYPASPWDEGATPHGSRGMARQIYHAALGGCGHPCPFVGDEDALGCKVAEGPVAAEGYAWEGGFYYPHREVGAPCPAGYDDGANCVVGRYDRGRDAPRIHRQPLFYVSAQDGACPPGATYDGANCLLATGPVGAGGFIYDAGSGDAFYWSPREDEPPCAPPGGFDGANCHVAPVPDGWIPFIAYRSHFYVEPVTCWPKRPLHFGETGFSVFPNGDNLDPDDYAGHDRRWAKYESCVDEDGAPREDTRPMGTEAEQVAFLTGDAAAGWPGLFDASHACGFQGMHWWALGSVNWGMCSEDNFGLYAFWYLQGDAPPGGDPRALVPRAGAAAFREAVDYTAAPAMRCEEPPDFRASPRRDEAPARYRFRGRVVDPAGEPVPNAMFYAWDLGWGPLEATFTDPDGRFALARPGCLEYGGATHFGMTNDTRGLASDCPSPSGDVVDVELGDFEIARRDDLPTEAELAPPRQRTRMCLVDGDWVAAPE